GHMFAGWITFSSAEEDGETEAQCQVLMRAQDPLTEMGLMLGGHRKEDRFWEDTLRALAGRVGVDADPEATVVCVARRRQRRPAAVAAGDDRPLLERVPFRDPYGHRAAAQARLASLPCQTRSSSAPGRMAWPRRSRWREPASPSACSRRRRSPAAGCAPTS